MAAGKYSIISIYNIKCRNFASTERSIKSMEDYELIN